MLGERTSLNILERALSLSKADQTEALLLAQDSALTRFAANVIHQNVAESSAELRVRAVLGQRVGVATTRDVSATGVARVVQQATDIARVQAENPDFRSLPEPEPLPEVPGYNSITARWNPNRRARWAATICRMSREQGLYAAGAFETGLSETAVANSLGIQAYHAGALAQLNTTVMSDNSAGYSERITLNAEEVDAEALAREAIARATQGRDAVAFEPCECPVVLEPYAVADMLDMLSYLGFSATALQEDRSFMKIGEPLMGSNINIWDDALDPTGVPMPFDYEGVPKRRLDIVKDGIAIGVAYDSYTAGKEGKKSTGHALPAPNAWGPFPLNQFLGAGNSSREEMIRSTQQGLLVTRFWYTRPVEPLKAVITGMTRDGTFLIEDGEVTWPVKNLRFTQSYVDALKSAELISRETKLSYNGYAAARVPWLKLGAFRFTGLTG